MADSYAPGSIIRVRDESWMVTQLNSRGAQTVIHALGLSELVRDTQATFIEGLDSIQVEDPKNTAVRADDSPHYRRARLWLEATLRKTHVPVPYGEPVISDRMLLDPLPYQRTAVKKALDPRNLRPRILLADAVGLGKTLEIGMILSELVRRGRGERILVVAPAHVLEQFQHELWTRFALPLVRLDSVGIQRIRQQVPSTKNPFSVIKRAIVSIDTLKSQKYLNHLKKVEWDAVVIDESHNLTNTGTQNNALARVLAPNTDALILASATPHNGRKESFAELLRLLDPTAVDARGNFNREAMDRLVIRRHRNSPEVASIVGQDWAPRQAPRNILIEPTPIEDEIATELAEVWLHPDAGSALPLTNRLFPWTLAKAFLSSNAALRQSVQTRINTLTDNGKQSPEGKKAQELEALRRLQELTDRAEQQPSAKFERLVAHLKEIGISASKETRVVIFSERVATLEWLREQLQPALKLKAENLEILHGGLDDQTQQNVIESFKMKNSPVRILITGDVASEGVNLHSQCHHMVHYDIPWSLIRIEQRNGRIDRYGQKFEPEIVTLLLQPTHQHFSGDVRVLSRLMDREHEAHQALGTAASLMGEWSEKREEDAIIQVLSQQKSEDEVFKSVADEDPDFAWAGFDADDFFDFGDVDITQEDLSSSAVSGNTDSDRIDNGGYTDASLYDSSAQFLTDAVFEIIPVPSAKRSLNGIEWEVQKNAGIIMLAPTPDLKKRLRVLPQTYLQNRQVMERMMLATSVDRGRQSLIDAQQGEKKTAKTSGIAGTWPQAHYLSPLHPVLEWASDRVMSKVQRQEILAVRADVDYPTILLLGTYMNHNGQIVQRAYYTVGFLGKNPLPETISDVRDYFEQIGFTAHSNNPGPVQLPNPDELHYMVATAIDSAEELFISTQKLAADSAARELKQLWQKRIDVWEEESGILPGLSRTSTLKTQSTRVSEEKRLAEKLEPSQHLLRPLLMVLPLDTPLAQQSDK